MSEAAHADTDQHHHEEHLEVWPDAGITETAKPLPWWLLVLAIGFSCGLFMAYWNQFVNHSMGYPKFGPGYDFLSEEAQYPGKINPVITTTGKSTFTRGKEGVLMLEAVGGRVGQRWELVDGNLPPGVAITLLTEQITPAGTRTSPGVALFGTPSKAGEFTFTLRCISGQGYADKQITIEVEE